MSIESIAGSKIPLIVMSFDRPEYLAQVLDSLVNQTALAERPIYLFQDNAVNAYSGKRYARDEDIARSAALFKSRFPAGTVMLAEHNLGICENFLRAERFAFEELDSEVAYFLEDDMVLSPHYLTMMDRMCMLAAQNPRIGYFAAYGDLAKSRKPKPISGIQRLEHHWGFGITRRHWHDLHVWLKPYYDSVVGRDYRARPTAQIFADFHARDLPLTATSQDGAKKVGTYALGRVSINTIACFARYIGEEGVHCTPAIFKKNRFDTTIMHNEPVEIVVPTDERLDGLQAEELETRWRALAKKGFEIAKTKVPPARQAAPKPRGRQLVQAMFGTDIYANPVQAFAADPKDTGDTYRALGRLVARHKPQIVFDIGAGAGASTVEIATRLRGYSKNGIAVAIDTFLGSPEQWQANREAGADGLLRRNGFPMLYWRFLANVMASGVKDHVLPLPQTLENAVEILKRLGLSPDMIHWAAAGDHRSVRRQLRTYYELLAPRGIVVGSSADANIKRAATEFTESNHLDLNAGRRAWYFQKPG